MIQSAGDGLLFSVICLYLLTAMLVMWKPGHVPVDLEPDLATSDNWLRRLNSALIANTTILAVAGLMAGARAFSYLGDKLVDVVVRLVEGESGRQCRHSEL